MLEPFFPLKAPVDRAEYWHVIPKTVLVADDMQIMRVMLTRVLARAGYEVIEAADGQSAVELASERHPVLAILDWEMPRMTGFDACRRLRSDPQFGQMVIVILSGRGDDQERAAALGAGADECLMKPIEPLALLGRIHDLLAAKAA